MDELQPRLRAADADRHEVLSIVQRAYEVGRLDLDEVRDRQERALKAKYTDELPALVTDLPEGAELSLRPPSEMTERQTHGTLPATGPADGGAHVAIMSGRTVLVEPGTRDLSCFSMMGGNEYDLSQAMGPGRVVTLTLNSIMGGCNVFVPEGVRVIDQTVAFMGGNSIRSSAQGDGSNGTVVIKGFQTMGGNEVKRKTR